MALDFSGANSDRVDLGSGASIDNVNTISLLIWFKIPSPSGNPQLLWDKTIASFARFRQIIAIQTNRLDIIFSRATTAAQARSVDNAFVANAWSFAAFTWDGSGAPKIFTGDINTAATEVSYATSQAGSGAPDDDSAESMLLGAQVTLSSGCDGDIATFQMFDVELSLADIVLHQFHPHNTADCVVLMPLGFNGSSAQADWSGNSNNGTVTGATVTDHVPLPPPFGFDLGWQGTFTAAAAASMAYPGRNHPSRNLLLRL